MLHTLKSLALSCCVLCTFAGMVRLFLPENSLKPVINGVLVLYILATVLQMTRHADWAGFARQLRNESSVAGTATADYGAYTDALAEQASVQAVAQLLENNKILATVTSQNGHCHITLQTAQDLPAAQALLAGQTGTLPYEIEVKG